MKPLLYLLASLLLFVPLHLNAQQDSIPSAKSSLLWQSNDSIPIGERLPPSQSALILFLDGELIQSTAKRDSIITMIGYYNSQVAHIDTLSESETIELLGYLPKAIVLNLRTRKEVQARRPWIQYRTELGISWIGRRPEMLSPEQWIGLSNEAYQNDGLAIPYPEGSPQPKLEDWQQQMQRQGLQHSHQLTVYGNGKYWQKRYLSLSSFNQQAPFTEAAFDRYQGRIKLERQTPKQHRFGLNLNAAFSQQSAYLPLLGEWEGIAFHTLLAPPIQSNSDALVLSESPFGERFYHPLNYQQERQQQLAQLIGNLHLYYNLVHDGNWKMNNSLSLQQWQSRQSLILPDPDSDLRFVQQDNSRLQSLQHRTELAYEADVFLDHQLSFFYNFRQEYYFWNLNRDGLSPSIPSRWRSYYNSLHFRYHNNQYWPELSGAIEWAMSDRMQPSQQMAFFPSLRLKWAPPHRWGFWWPRLNLAWSNSGNDGSTLLTQLADLSLQQPFLTRENQFLTRNPGWERQNSFSASLNFNPTYHFNFSINAYHTTSQNLWVALPNSDQYWVWQNLASVRNKGVEFNLRYVNLRLVEDLYISGDIGYQFNHNRLLDLGNQTQLGVPLSGQLGFLQVDEALGGVGGYETDGLYQEGDDFSLEPDKQPGDLRLVDQNADGRIDAEDHTLIARTLPIHTYAASMNLSFRSFALNMQWYGQAGHQIVNYQRLYGLQQIDGSSHLFAEAIKRWTPENTDTDIPRATLNGESRLTDLAVESGNFLRLKEVKLSWNPLSSFHHWRTKPFYEMQLSLIGENLLLFSPYTGYDPEIYLNGTPFYLGVDRGSYPRPRSISLGFNLLW